MSLMSFVLSSKRKPTLQDLEAHFHALDDDGLEEDLERLTKIRAHNAFLYFDAVPVTSRPEYRVRRSLEFNVSIHTFEDHAGREVQALLSPKPLSARILGEDLIVAAKATYLPLVALHLAHFKTLRFEGSEAPGGAVWPSFELSLTEDGAWVAVFDGKAQGTHEGRVHGHETRQHATAAEAVTFWAENILHAEPTDWAAGLAGMR